ncbi:hypothetical protein FRC08_018275 [Ceratobasidium sp. 394]|nr:hypothetical protein FRC08_018275 [Ceratobasidium sp. 394]KAG9079484.1 hypothetical protein FS749_008487 [Ceratobasidium sp. UAMH 11750]
MQFQSSLARLAAFAFFLLSFSMLVCAAPAPVAAPGAGELAVRDSSLVARTYDWTTPCKNLLVKLEADIKVKADTLPACSKTPGCDCKSILGEIATLINACIGTIQEKVKGGATVDVSVCIDICIRIIVYILLKLSLCINITLAICVDIVIACTAFIKLFLALCLDIAVKAKFVLDLKIAITSYVALCHTLGFIELLKICGL